MPNIRFYEAQISWRNIFPVSSLCQGQRQFSLSENFSDYNNILIIMIKDAAQHLYISVTPKKSLLKIIYPKLFLAKTCKKFWETFWKLDVSLGTTTFFICLLKSHRFAQFLCHLMWLRWFNFLVNDLSVVKSLTRFCFSVPFKLIKN